MDLQKLICEVQARPAIWDQKNTHYHNRDIILKMWGEIARACNVSSDVAKSKWKHLRDNFRNELKKTYRSKQSCDGGSPSTSELESKWVWFKSLQFLRDQMNSRVFGCGNAGIVQTGHVAASLEGTQIEPQIDILEGEEEAHFDDFIDADSCQSILTGDELLPQVPIKKRAKMNKKQIFMDLNDNQNIERKRYEIIRRRFSCHDNHDDDDTYHFLMSVKNPMRSLPLERQMFVRLKIQEIILNEITALQHDTKYNLATVSSLSENGLTTNNNNYFS